jgi:hypothetical protein
LRIQFLVVGGELDRQTLTGGKGFVFGVSLIPELGRMVSIAFPQKPAFGLSSSKTGS